MSEINVLTKPQIQQTMHRTGKHYVCADIHGNLARYQQMMEHINTCDYLYILGDVIDRGIAGIDILKDIMTRDNVTLLLGNHEEMMLQSLHYKDEEAHLNWVQLCNGGGITEYMWNQEDPVVQDDILQYLISCNISYQLQVNETNYILCHSGTLPGITTLAYQNATAEQKDIILWYSPFRKDLHVSLEYYDLQYRYIIGHVPVQKMGQDTIVTIDNITDIDCGCAYTNCPDQTSLALLCLEDLSCQYFQ